MIARPELLTWPGGAVADTVASAIKRIGAKGSFTMSELERAIGKSMDKRTVRARVHDLMREGFLTPDPPLKRFSDKPSRLLVNDPQLPADCAITVSARLPLQIPRTYDGLWALMRWLDKHRGHFSLVELLYYVKTEIDAGVVRSYVRHLSAHGFIVVHTQRRAADGGCCYRIARRQVETPRFKSNGERLPSAQRADQLWRAIKMCGFFTAREVAMAASIPECVVPEIDARRYCDDLTAAGYLMARSNNEGHTIYRLRPKMQTGPAAPQLLRARLVWDPNIMQIVGQGIGVEEVRL